jgi:hypothetical protein
MQSRIKSLSQNTGAFIFTTGNFTKVYPVESTAKAGEVLAEFARDVGIPTDLRADLASYFSGRHTEFVKEAKRLRVKLTYAEKGRHNQNHAAEREIRDLKRRWHNKMVSKGAPKRLWDYGIVHQAEIMSRMSRGRTGRTGYEDVTGETPDISEWVDFDFYDWVWYHDPPDTMAETTEEIRKLGKWLGVANRVGSALTYWILTDSAKVIARSTVQHVTAYDQLNDDIKHRMNRFQIQITQRLDETGFVIENVFESKNVLQDEDLLDDPAYGDGSHTPSDEEYRMELKPPGRLDEDDIQSDAYDKYIGAELTVDFGMEGKRRATVKERVRDFEGNFVGRSNENPYLDTSEYIIEYDDGTSDRMFANAIAENIYTQVDNEGRHFVLLKEITDHRNNEDAITVDEGFVVVNGQRKPKKTTKGWELLVEWKDGAVSWVPLKEIKESNPVEVAEYAIANKIDHEPAFAWWVNTVMKKRERIISKLQKKYWRTDYKFGIRIPKSVDEALQIDRLTGTKHWENALKKEMSKVSVAYKARDDVTPEDVRKGKVPDLNGYQEIKCHIVFDVKMDFTRKARFVAGGHMTQPSSSVTYSSVVSRDSVRLAFLIAALNGLSVLSCDIGNAYLNAPCREKIWFQAGRECGADAGKVMVITRALYGLRTSGASWRQTLADTLLSPEFGYFQSRVDPDVYMKRRSKPNAGDYYEMILVFVDDILCISHAPTDFMERIGKVYDLRDSAREPDVYLGANIYKHQTPNGNICWAMSSNTYIKNALETVKELLREEGKVLRTTKRRGRTALPVMYKPELDQSQELSSPMVSRYLQLIGILRWAVELGRIDIALETAIMSQYSAAPREGHLEAVYHIFAYLATNPSSKIVFDPKTPLLDESSFVHDVDWKPFYGNVEEQKPDDAPFPLGLPVEISCFVDANHAGNLITRRSHTGIIIFVQNAPILWFSKKQNTVESSTFGSELVALRIARDMIASLRIKLQLFGVPLAGPASVLCDNQGVVKNTSIPESTLTKKHNAINYHIVREAAAMGMIRVGKEDTDTNLADLLTKVLSQPRREKLIMRIMYIGSESQESSGGEESRSKTS